MTRKRGISFEDAVHERLENSTATDQSFSERVNNCCRTTLDIEFELGVRGIGVDDPDARRELILDLIELGLETTDRFD